jgi:methyl-accepting chemotaxis protein
MTLSQKLWLPLILSVLCFTALSVFDAYRTRDIRLTERQADLRHTTELALAVVKTFTDQASAGSITVDVAKQKAMDAVRNMRYGDAGGYFVIQNTKGVMLMHPIAPELQGKNLFDAEDSNGVHYTQNMIDIANRDGRGYTRYSVPKPGVGGVFPKISYIDSYQPWDWILLSGVYIDDIDAAFRTTLYESLSLPRLPRGLRTTI